MNKQTTGILFPGYGSQYVGMGKDFYDAYRVVQELFEQAGDCTGLNFVKLCFAGSERTLDQPLNAYLALFVVQSSMYIVLRERGIIPKVVGGWGVGTLSAHHAAGVLSFPDALYLLKKYIAFFSKVMEFRSIVAIRVKGIARARLEEYLAHSALKGRLVLAVVMADEDYGLAGDADAIQQFKEFAAVHAVACVLQTRFCYGVHLLALDEFVRLLMGYLEKIDCRALRIALVAQNGSVYALGSSLEKAAFLKPLCGPIEAERFAAHFKTCQRVIHLGHSRMPLPDLGRYVAPAPVSVCKTVVDLKGFF